MACAGMECQYRQCDDSRYHLRAGLSVLALFHHNKTPSSLCSLHPSRRRDGRVAPPAGRLMAWIPLGCCPVMTAVVRAGAGLMGTGIQSVGGIFVQPGCFKSVTLAYLDFNILA